MRVLVTGATGFVGRWLVEDLTSAGHTAIPAPGSAELDLAGSPDLAPLIRDARPDVVAHLAAVTFLPDAEGDPERARQVNAGGTEALFAGLDETASRAPVLVTSSADVYRYDARLPIDESAAVAPTSAYGRSKLAQEAVALDAAQRGRRITIVRPFNHIGPGQRPVFVVPALATRVLASKQGHPIKVGNVGARRDLTDVRDIVRAYRLLLERMSVAPADAKAIIVNVGTGRSISIEAILRMLCEIAGVEPRWEVDPGLLRGVDVPDRVADVGLLKSLIDWEPQMPLYRSLVDVLRSAAASSG